MELATLDTIQWGRSDEAEQSLLGALLLDNTAYDKVADLINGDDFFILNHAGIFRVISRLIEAGRAADWVTVNDALKDEFPKVFESIGPAYLAALVQNTPSTLSIRRYAEVIRDKAIRRALHRAASEIQESIRSPGARESAELLDAAQGAVMAIGEHQPQSFRPLQDGLRQAFEFIDHQYHRDGDGPTGVPYGFLEIDNFTGGMHPGQLIVVGARPSMGKSTLALNVCENASRRTDAWSLFFTIEMGLREQALRVLASSARINVQRLAAGRVNDDEWGRIASAMERLQDLKLSFNEQAQLNITEIRAQARREAREKGGKIAVIAVDYLQLMVGGENEQNRAIQISEITRGLKLLGREMGVPILLLSQLNRGVESRTNKRPMLSDLRDSGAIEQDADVVMFIYRDEVYNPNTSEKGKAEIIIAKQRNGPVGTVFLTFLGGQTAFRNYAAD